jgi:hypothetical protein
MGNNVVCAICDSLETAHDFPKDYPITIGHRYVPQLDHITTGQLFNLLLSRINWDGMDPRTFSLAELHGSIEGAEWPK